MIHIIRHLFVFFLRGDQWKKKHPFSKNKGMKPNHQIFPGISSFLLWHLLTIHRHPRHGRDPKAAANVGSGSFDFPKVWVTKMAGKYIMTWQVNPKDPLRTPSKRSTCSRSCEAFRGLQVRNFFFGDLQESNPTL